MKVGIGVFAYSRYTHLSKVLSGLKQNSGVEEIYIFQDGLKYEADRGEWEKTRSVIEGIKWCKTKKFFSAINLGLADSIVSGINKVLEENDAIIVLEDDCVPLPSFVTFMKNCLEKYADNEEVYSVSGYSWPLNIEKRDSDIYFCGRACPWGWGTWKKNWKIFKRDYDSLRRIKNNQQLSKELSFWGADLQNMLIGNLNGKNNSWYVFWTLLIIERGGLCINPYKSLINNIGFDGNGVHCASGGRFQNVELNMELVPRFCLPEKLEIEEEVKREFIKLYGTPAAIEGVQTKEKALIYGMGKCFCENIPYIHEQYNVIGYVDKNVKDGFFAGKRVIHPKQLAEIDYDIIVLAIENEKLLQDIKSELLLKYKVDEMKIRPFVKADNYLGVVRNSKMEGMNAVLENALVIDSEIGYRTYIGKNTMLEKVKIGKYCSLGPNLQLIQGRHPSRNFVSTHPAFFSVSNRAAPFPYVSGKKFEEHSETEGGKSVEIGNDVWIGANVMLMEGVSIADGTIIAAGSVVVKNTEPYSIIGGNPASLIRFRFEKEEMDFLVELKWWNKPESWIKEYAEYFEDIKLLKSKLEGNQK